VNARVGLYPSMVCGSYVRPWTISDTFDHGRLRQVPMRDLGGASGRVLRQDLGPCHLLHLGQVLPPLGVNGVGASDLGCGFPGLMRSVAHSLPLF